MDMITFNGKTYRSVDEMPPAVRKAYEKIISIVGDADRDGLPDILQGQVPEGAEPMAFHYNGKTYTNIDELPAEAREQYREAIQNMDRDRNGIPDFVEAAAGLFIKGEEITDKFRGGTDLPQPPKPAPPIPETPVLETVGTNLTVILLTGLLLFLLCVLALFAWVLLNN